MRVLFINKYDVTGGAGVAAYRLHQGLSRYHRTKDEFLVGIKRSNDGIVTETRRAGVQSFLERGLNQVFNLAGLQYVFFPFSTSAILRSVQRFQPDVISLHNLHGGYFDTSLLSTLSRFAPLVWTLHDMWAFTANAAHTFGDESWKHMRSGGMRERRSFPSIGVNTGSWLLERKKRIYAESNLTIVTPSEWLRGLASQAPVLKGKHILRIPNGIDLQIFRPMKSEARKRLGIPPDARVVMFAAERLGKTEYKGGEDFKQILQLLAEQTAGPLHVLMVGAGSLRGLTGTERMILHQPGYIQSENELAHCYSAADVLLHVTRADNFPSALLEAGACGTPCVTFNVGGCGEIVRDGKTGYVVQPGDYGAFVAGARSLLEGPSLRNRLGSQARSATRQHFSLKSMANSYHSLFLSLVRPSTHRNRGRRRD